VISSSSKKFIVATEDGIFHQMKKARPDVELLQAPIDEACSCNQCPYMKLNTLEKIRNSLRDLSPQVSLSPKLLEASKLSLDRMMKITRGERVEWPKSFKAPNL
jgi:quinolinate synthase